MPKTGYIKYITDDEFIIILKYIKKIDSDSMKMLLHMLCYTGLRVGEICKLKTENIVNNYESIEYYPLKKKNKIKKRRYMPKFLKTELALYFSNNYKKMRNGFLFPPNRSSKNLHIQTSSVRMVFVRLRRKTGIDDYYYTTKNGTKIHRLSPHTLRHYVIYRLFKATGRDLIATRDIIGHNDTKTTEKYVYAFDSIQKEKSIVDKMWE